MAGRPSCGDSRLEAGVGGYLPCGICAGWKEAGGRSCRAASQITGYSGHFVAEPTGCDRLRPAAARQGLCSRFAVGGVPA